MSMNAADVNSLEPTWKKLFGIHKGSSLHVQLKMRAKSALLAAHKFRIGFHTAFSHIHAAVFHLFADPDAHDHL